MLIEKFKGKKVEVKIIRHGLHGMYNLAYNGTITNIDSEFIEIDDSILIAIKSITSVKEI